MPAQLRGRFGRGDRSFRGFACTSPGSPAMTASIATYIGDRVAVRDSLGAQPQAVSLPSAV